MPSNKLVQSVTRALMILELLSTEEDGLTLQQLCQELDLKSPTAHNLLRTLMDRGFVDKLDSPVRYRLGNAMIDLVDQYRNRGAQRLAARAVSSVFAQFGNIRTTYCEEIGGDVVLKLRMTPERPGLLEKPWHSVMLAYTSASVLVFQAFWRDDQRFDYTQRYPFEQYGATSWESEEQLAAFLDEVRAKGYAAPPVTPSGLSRIAVPVFGPGNSLIGALGAAFETHNQADLETTKQAILMALCREADLIAAEFRS